MLLRRPSFYLGVSKSANESLWLTVTSRAPPPLTGWSLQLLVTGGKRRFVGKRRRAPNGTSTNPAALTRVDELVPGSSDDAGLGVAYVQVEVRNLFWVHLQLVRQDLRIAKNDQPPYRGKNLQFGTITQRCVEPCPASRST